jgi:hypothetical protein
MLAGKPLQGGSYRKFFAGKAFAEASSPESIAESSSQELPPHKIGIHKLPAAGQNGHEAAYLYTFAGGAG